MTLPKILLQLDPDPQASVFDAIVAIDAGVDRLVSRSGVVPDRVRELVHGAIFTRGPSDLHQTAIFIGGTDVGAGEAILEAVTRTFFGPMRVSVMLDSNGANTTAAAAVASAARHLSLDATRALVLGATGPVGARVVELLARQGATVRAASRQQARADALVRRVRERTSNGQLEPIAVDGMQSLSVALNGIQLVISAGAAGATLFPESARRAATALKVVIDVNAVPPLGVPWIEVTDKGRAYDQLVAYGAIGVGGLKMKVHKESIRRLFQTNDRRLDAPEILEIALELASKPT